MWQVRGYNGDSLWVWGISAPYGDSTLIEEFIDSTGVTFPLMPTAYGDSIISLYGITYTPKYFAICPDHSMKGFEYGAEENIVIFIDNCQNDTTTNINGLINNISVTYFANKLQLTSKTEDDVLIFINNSIGQQIGITKQKLNKGNNSIDLDINKGFYIINIYSEKHKYLTSIKIMVKGEF